MDEMVKKTQEWLNKTYKGKEGYTAFSKDEIDGITGQGTFRRLIQALQIELRDKYGAKITVDGDFGDGTLSALPNTIGKSNNKNNMTYIIQGSLWCKGYSAGPLDGIYGASVEKGVKAFQKDAGISDDGIIRPYILKGIMNTDSYAYNGEMTGTIYHKHRVQLDMNKLFGSRFGIVAPNGEWERKSHKTFIKCCQYTWGIKNPDGVWGNNTSSKAPVLSSPLTGSGMNSSIMLLQWALAVNEFYQGSFNSVFDEATITALENFKKFMCIGNDSIVDKTTWANLLTSRGDTSRVVKAFDTASRLTLAQAKYFKSSGYTDVGRYLTNTPGGTLNKALTIEELKSINEAGLRVFPIFQTRGNKAAYFNFEQGCSDGSTARDAVNKLRLGYTTIYFAVDYDAKMADIKNCIIPYFEGIKMSSSFRYKIGVYGPRAVCNALKEQHLTTESFVADMSSGFTGNIGQPMPSNWAYRQIIEVNEKGIGIDRCDMSPRATAQLIDSTKKEDGMSFKEACSRALYIVELFEGATGSDAYGNIATGAVDGCGFSLGALQWNIKWGLLQEMLKEMRKDHMEEMMEKLGEKYLDVSNMLDMDTISEQLSWANTTYDENGFKDGWEKALVTLATSKGFVSIQDEYIKKAFDNAVDKCHIKDFEFKTLRAFIMMLNIGVNGGGFEQEKIDRIRKKFKESTDLDEVSKLKIIANIRFANNDTARARCYFIIDGSMPVNKINYSDIVEKCEITDDIIVDLP